MKYHLQRDNSVYYNRFEDMMSDYARANFKLKITNSNNSKASYKKYSRKWNVKQVSGSYTLPYNVAKIFASHDSILRNLIRKWEDHLNF